MQGSGYAKMINVIQIQSLWEKSDNCRNNFIPFITDEYVKTVTKKMKNERQIWDNFNGWWKLIYISKWLLEKKSM